jgi:hypothetical protein
LKYLASVCWLLAGLFFDCSFIVICWLLAVGCWLLADFVAFGISLAVADLAVQLLFRFSCWLLADCCCTAVGCYLLTVVLMLAVGFVSCCVAFGSC